MTVEHHRSAFRFARRRLTGWRVVLVPLAAVVFTVRAGVALAVRAVSARAGGRRVSG
jgi:hypothetical protein